MKIEDSSAIFLNFYKCRITLKTSKISILAADAFTVFSHDDQVETKRNKTTNEYHKSIVN